MKRVVNVDIPPKDHENNWIVIRHKSYVKHIKELENKEVCDQNNPTEMAFKRANNLIRYMQMLGPVQDQFPNYRYDSTQDLYHCHVTMGKNSYDVIWEADEAKKLIHVLDVGARENFDYKRKTPKKESIELAVKTMSSYPHYQRLLLPDMKVSEEVKKIACEIYNKPLVKKTCTTRLKKN